MSWVRRKRSLQARWRPSDFAMRATILQNRSLIWEFSGKHPKSSHVSSEVSTPVLPRLQLNPGLASLTLTLLHTIIQLHGPNVASMPSMSSRSSRSNEDGPLGPRVPSPAIAKDASVFIPAAPPGLFSEVAAAPNNNDPSSESRSLGSGGLSRDLSQRVSLSGRG